MIAPYANGSSYVLTSRYGYRNLGSGQEMHHGIDLVSYGSKTIIAVKAGTVIQIVTSAVPKDTVQLRGNYIKIRHNDNTTAYYQHLNDVFVNVGDTVVIGTELGTEGNTGRVFSSTGGSGNHLHLEFRDASNNSINPADIVDIPNAIGTYNPSDTNEQEDSDETFVSDKIEQELEIEKLPNATETDPSKYGFNNSINGKYESIYKDYTVPPVIDSSDYEKELSIFNIEQFKDISKNNSGEIKNKNEPYPVDAKINQLEKHTPQVVFNEAEISNANGMSCTFGNESKFDEVISLLDLLSKRVEKRLIQLDNISATNMRYLHRLSSRINVNCLYYGGQSIYNKYLCIRCLDNDLLNDNPVSLDQCLNCSRYEPVIGQVYNIDDTDSNMLHTSILYDDMHASRVSSDNIISNIKVNEYRKEPDKMLGELSEPVENNDTEKIVDWRETELDEQAPDISEYNYKFTSDLGMSDSPVFETGDLMSLNAIISSIFGDTDNGSLNTGTVRSITGKMAYKMLESEGFAATKYRDGELNGKQYYSIGYGHQILDTENFDNGITQAQAVELFKNDIKTREDYVYNYCKKHGVADIITQNQFDSLVCTVYSLGIRTNIYDAAMEYIKNPTAENAAAYKAEMESTGIYLQTFVKDENGNEKSEKVFSKALYNRRMYEYEIFMNGAY